MSIDISAERTAADEAFNQGDFDTARRGYLRAAVAAGVPEAEQLIEVMVADRLARAADSVHPAEDRGFTKEQHPLATAARSLANGDQQVGADLAHLGFVGGLAIGADDKRTAESIARGDWLSAAASGSSLPASDRVEILTTLVEAGHVDPNRARSALLSAGRESGAVAAALYRYAAEAYVLADQPGFAAMATAQHAKSLADTGTTRAIGGARPALKTVEELGGAVPEIGRGSGGYGLGVR